VAAVVAATAASAVARASSVTGAAVVAAAVPASEVEPASSATEAEAEDALPASVLVSRRRAHPVVQSDLLPLATPLAAYDLWQSDAPRQSPRAFPCSG
jgi:hypothetical protein